MALATGRSKVSDFYLRRLKQINQYTQTKTRRFSSFYLGENQSPFFTFHKSKDFGKDFAPQLTPRSTTVRAS